jgi:hypothetical protein
MGLEVVPPPDSAILRSGERVIAIVGGYGSGKTELSVNLALQLAARGQRVQIADLDIVNPYFRCREARDLMEARGIRVVVPPGAQAWADLPIILPEVRGMLHPPAGMITILDVGGDDAGARSLASFRTSIADGEYELWQVINAKRPFTSTVDGCVQMIGAIETASRWRVTGLAANAHLIEETTAETVVDGWALASSVSDRTGLPVRFVGAMAHIAGAVESRAIAAPILRLHRHMLPPWLQSTERSSPGASALPAPRPVPIGRRHATAFFEGGRRGQNRD